jgi:hypothetical protein
MKSDDATDAIDELLRGLPLPPQDPATSARSLRRARGVFLRQHDLSVPERFWNLYLRAEPVLAASIVVVYLGWAVDTVSGLLR